MESDKKLKEIIENQHILNEKLNRILAILYNNQIITNCQMFIQGITLADIMDVDKKDL